MKRLFIQLRLDVTCLIKELRGKWVTFARGLEVFTITYICIFYSFSQFASFLSVSFLTDIHI